MNVLLITHPYLPSTGGVQRSVHNLSTGLASRGHAVMVAAHGECLFEWDRREPVPVLRLSIPTPFRRRIERHVRFAARDLFNLTLLTAICLWRRIDVVHCHLVNVDTRYGEFLRRWLGIPMVVTLRGGELDHWLEGMLKREIYVRKMLETADAVTALSATQLAAARLFAPSMTPLTAVIPNAVDPERLQALAGDPAPVGRPYAVFSGRLEAEKSIGFLIGAYHSVLAAEPSYPLDLVIAGGGSMAGELRSQAAAGAGAGRIRFTGELDYRSSLSLIRSAALLVLPTERGEGCPNALLEAMALGTPVLASATAPVLELIDHGRNGETFRPGDARDLRAALGRLALDPEIRARYSEAGRDFVNRYHRMGSILEHYESLYRKLAGQNPPR